LKPGDDRTSAATVDASLATPELRPLVMIHVSEVSENPFFRIFLTLSGISSFETDA